MPTHTVKMTTAGELKSKDDYHEEISAVTQFINLCETADDAYRHRPPTAKTQEIYRALDSTGQFNRTRNGTSVCIEACKP